MERRPTRPGAIHTRFGLATLAYGLLLFGTAGTVRWPEAWIFMAISLAVLGAYTVIMVRVHPGLIEERRHPPKDAKSWDKPFVFAIGVVGPFVSVVLAGLDRRFHWSAPMGPWIEAPGLLLVALGGALSNYAVASNPFFSALVRIQTDRGHTVVDSGPYQCVRHPSYLGSLLQMSGTGFALGSWPVVTLCGVLNVVLVARTAREDDTLRAELPGYEEYAQRVRYRLMPWVF